MRLMLSVEEDGLIGFITGFESPEGVMEDPAPFIIDPELGFMGYSIDELLSAARDPGYLNIKTEKKATETKEAAEYVDRAPNQEYCAVCTMFITPDRCTLVKGHIDAGGHCKYWEKNHGSSKGSNP